MGFRGHLRSHRELVPVVSVGLLPWTFELDRVTSSVRLHGETRNDACYGTRA
jgi:hypothetical protein